MKDTLALFLGLEGAGLEKEDFSNDFLDPLLGLLLGGACDVVDTSPVLSLIALRCLSVVPFLRLRGFDDDDAMRCYETTKNYWRM